VIALAEPIDADALRVRHEYLSDPDLQLSTDDVVARLHVQPRHALRMLESLVREQFLSRAANGRYVRLRAGNAVASQLLQAVGEPAIPPDSWHSDGEFYSCARDVTVIRQGC